MSILTKGLSPDFMLATANSIERELVKLHTNLALLKGDLAAGDEMAANDMTAVRKKAASLRAQVLDWREKAAAAKAEAEASVELARGPTGEASDASDADPAS